MVGKIRDQVRGSILRVEEKGIPKRCGLERGHRGTVDAWILKSIRARLTTPMMV